MHTPTKRIATSLALCASVFVGQPNVLAAPKAMTLTSSAFTAGGAIPKAHSCLIQSTSTQVPPLAWSAPPKGTKTIVVGAFDIDAPGGTFHHYGTFNIDPKKKSIPRNFSNTWYFETRNDGGYGSFYALCPPLAQTHRYTFYVAALSKSLNKNKQKIDGDDALGTYTAKKLYADITKGSLKKSVLGFGTLSGTLNIQPGEVKRQYTCMDLGFSWRSRTGGTKEECDVLGGAYSGGACNYCAFDD